jgi:hypothetical protein
MTDYKYLYGFIGWQRKYKIRWGAVHKQRCFKRKIGATPEENLLHKPHELKETTKGGTGPNIIANLETTSFMDGPHEERFYFRYSSLPLRRTSSLTIITDTSIKRLSLRPCALNLIGEANRLGTGQNWFKF